MLERIVQVSRAASGLRVEDVYGIIRAAHPANTLGGLTGGLIHLDGWFAQVLEGAPGPALDACLERIGRDPRHRAIERRSRERALCRLFPGQAMALRSRACIDPGLLDGFGWRPGFPVADFPADVLVEFVVRACRSRDRASGPRRPAA
jgi:Sensors of blue-light using FAD